jgi:fatty-acyl-CoA synthase
MGSDIERRRAALADRYRTWEPTTLGGFLRRQAERYGDRPFVITDERTVTYAQVDAWATRLADGLAAVGVRPGDRVGIVMANHLEFAPVKFAVARAGAVAIPFNYLYRTDELAYVLRQSRCDALVTMTSFAGLDHLAMLDEIAPGWERGPTDALPHLRRVVLFPTDDRRRDGAMTLADLEAAGRAAPGGADDSGVSPFDDGDILYTSGTTGSPKGVVVSHDAPVRTAYASALTRAFGDGRRVLFSLPCYHMFGLVEGLLAVMHVGGAIVPRLTFSAADYLAAVERHHANDLLAAPTMAVALLEHPDRHTRDLSSLDAILCGAAPAPTWVWERAATELGITEVTTGYGMTECGGSMVLTLPEDPLERHTTTVGRVKMAGAAGLPDHGGALCVYATADVDTGEPLPEGAEGELVSRGPTHMRGFWDKPDETAVALRDGWLHSGDLGLIGADGYLRLTGRSKELYKSGGELVMPKEIEELVVQVPGVSQAFAIGVPDERWGEAGCVWIVPEPGATVEADAVLALCRDKLARFKVPKHVVFSSAAELPTTATGKVQKFRMVPLAADKIAGAS